MVSDPTSGLSAKAALHRWTRQLFQCAATDPASRGRLGCGQSPRHGDGGRVQGRVAPAHSPQRPAHTLLDEVALVVGRRLDQAQACVELRVGGCLSCRPGWRAAQRPRASRTRRALPLHCLHLGPRMRRPVEQLEADGVADAPVVEVAAPAIHLRGRDVCRVVHERRRAAALRTSRCPTARSPARDCDPAAWPAPGYSPSTRRTPWAR